jgi:hypothetical protein
LCNQAGESCWPGTRAVVFMELPEEATDSGAITTKQQAGNEGLPTIR